MTNKSAIRTKHGKFKKGTSGNPSGRPIGSQNRATLLAKQLLEGETEQLARVCINLAKKENIQALRMCLERVLPIRKERSIELELPPAQNLQRILTAAGEVRITPSEAQAMAEVVNSQAHLFATADMERRLQALEGFKETVQGYRYEQEAEMARLAAEEGSHVVYPKSEKEDLAHEN